MRYALLAVLLVVPCSALADDDNDGFSAGRVVVRGRAGADLGQAINIGGNNSAVNASGYVAGGLGYYILRNLEIGADLGAYMSFSPAFEFDSIELTPGMRYQVIPQFSIRAGVPIDLIPTFGLGVLVGAAFHQRIGNHASLVVGADYTYWLTPAFQKNAPGGRLEPHAGIQTYF